MAQRYSASQIRNLLRQAQQRQQQAINKYNQAARRYNQNLRTAVNQYNQVVRTHNARVRAHRQRVINELTCLSRQRTTQYVVYRTSVTTLYKSYQRLENQAEARSYEAHYNDILDLSERETANSLEVTNRLLGVPAGEQESIDVIENSALLQRLQEISPDLHDRWRGAMFALNPRNPDAARHFCTSAREIITQVIESAAPDSEVLQLLPACEKTDQGGPTRRSKISYFLHRRGMTQDTLEDFVEHDVENILQLFRVFNDGTHGSSGKFNLSQLTGIKKRVEDGIFFLTEIAKAV